MTPHSYIGFFICTNTSLIRNPRSSYHRRSRHDLDGVHIVQSLISSLWNVSSIGKMTTHNFVMSISGFKCTPRKWYLKPKKRIVGYNISTMKHDVTRLRTYFPNYSVMIWNTCSWNINELLSRNTLESIGEYTILTHYTDANIYNDMLYGSSIAVIIHVIN